MAKPLQLTTDVVPIHEFKTNASKLINQMKKTQRALVITQNGRPSAVVLTPEEYDALNYRRAFAEAVEEGLEDLEQGRVFTSDEVLEHIKTALSK